MKTIRLGSLGGQQREQPGQEFVTKLTNNSLWQHRSLAIVGSGGPHALPVLVNTSYMTFIFSIPYRLAFTS